MPVSPDFLLRRLRLRHLQLVVLLDRDGSLRSAAAALSLTQPAISKMLHEVEQAFGGQLFERGRRGVSPNALGQAVAQHARFMLGEIDRVADEVDAIQGGASATLRLGTLSVTSIVPAAVVDLCRRQPSARVRIREAPIRELIAQLQDGELDCVFGAIGNDALVSPSTDLLDVEAIFADRLCALVEEGHPLAGARRIAWHDLAGLRWITPPRETLVRQQFVAAFLRIGHAPPDPIVETLSPVTMIDMLRRDATLIGIARDERARFGAMSGLRRLEIVETMPLPPLCALTRRPAVERPAIVSEFLDALRRAARTASPRRRLLPAKNPPQP